MLTELHHLVTRVRGGAVVPRHSWSVFHPAVRSTALHPPHRLAITRSPHLNLVQTHVQPSRMQQTVMRWGLALAVGSATLQFVSNLHSVPITGRTQVVVLSADEEIEMGVTAAQEEMANLSFITTGGRHRMVVDIVSRLVAVCEHLFPRQYEWKVWLVDSPSTVNACCYPGGKILVYTGILDFIDVSVEKGLMPNKHDALAVILAHEIGHALARHTAERMSFLPLIFLQMVLSYESPLLQYLFEFAWNLPFSRVQEREADHIGIMLMAQACYDPRVAPMVWHAMESVFAGDENDLDFDFYSTHPSHKKRERRLVTLVDDAVALQRRASWCFQVKERVQQLLSAGASSSDPFFQRVLDFRRGEAGGGGRGSRRRNTVGTVHEMENEEIIKGLRVEQARLHDEHVSSESVE